MRVFDAQAVREKLMFAPLVQPVREAMIALSTGNAKQLLRSFIPLTPNHIFALMPAANLKTGYFGAKLLSVFPNKAGVLQHSGYVVLFLQSSGEPVCLADAEEVTRVRTAVASTVATLALARADASVLTVIGSGKQAAAHIEAIAGQRHLSEVHIWGIDTKQAQKLAERMTDICRLPVRTSPSVREAVRDADIICTVTGASEPVLEGKWVKPGTHVNVVGSSTPGPVEVDQDLVVNSRFFVDHREHVLMHGAEFLRAKRAGAITDDHIVAEIGEVLAGLKPGRTDDRQITVYKSLGHAVQDIAAAAWLYENA